MQRNTRHTDFDDVPFTRNDNLDKHNITMTKLRAGGVWLSAQIFVFFAVPRPVLRPNQPPTQWVPGPLFPIWKWPGLTCLEAKTQSDSETIYKLACVLSYFDKNIIQKQQAWIFPSSWISHAITCQKRAPFLSFHMQATTDPTFKTPGYIKLQVIDHIQKKKVMLAEIHSLETFNTIHVTSQQGGNCLRCYVDITLSV